MMKKWIKSFFVDDDKDKDSKNPRKEAQAKGKDKPKQEMKPLDNNAATPDYSQMLVEDVQYMFADLDLEQEVVQTTGATQLNEATEPKKETPPKAEGKPKAENLPKQTVKPVNETQAKAVTQSEGKTQPNGDVQTNGATPPKEVVLPNGVVQPNVTVQSNGINQAEGTTQQPNDANQPVGTTQQPNDANQPAGTAQQPNGANQPGGTAQPNSAIQANGVTPPASAAQSRGVFVPNAANQPKAAKIFTPKAFEVPTRLTVFLIENSAEVAVEEDNLERIVKKLATTGHVCVINYGRIVRESKIVEAKSFKPSDLVCEEFAGDDACLFDAIVALKGVVDKYYRKTEEVKFKKIRINGIDIIGIGRCIDNCSISSGKTAMESFAKIAKYVDITTKYFCIDEENFIRAATIGFHSIGGFARNYK